MTRRLLLLVLTFALLLAACGDDGNTDNTPIDTAQLIETAAQKLDETQSFQLSLTVSGAPVALDSTTIGLDVPILFQRAEGVFAAPDSLQADVTVLLDEVATEINIIAIGDEQFIRHAIITLGNWQAQTFSAGFNPITLGEGEQSIAAALRTMQNVEYVGEEDLDGISVHHIRGEVEASRVNAVTVGLIGTSEGMVKGDVYIRTGDGLLERLVLEEPINPDIDPDQASVWTIGIYGYDGDYAITRPDTQE